MVANVRGFTPSYNFKLINFDTPRWHTLEYENWALLDSLLLQSGVTPIRGVWANATAYLNGDRVFDAVSNELYRALVDHTSSITGTFADERTNNPGYWVAQTAGVPVFRGAWVSGASYSIGDIAVVDIHSYYLCIDSHIADVTFPPDAAHWVMVFDTTAAADAELAAEAAATAAALSASNALTSEVNADNSEGISAANATTATNAAVAASGSSGAAATSATNAATSATEAANQAAALKGTSLTSNTIGLGTKSFITQAGKQFNIGNFMTIVDTAAPTANVMMGQITAYAGTALDVMVYGTLGSGTKADWQLYISGAQGQAGAAGGGGIPDAPADSTLYGRINNAWQAAVKAAGDVMSGQLNIKVPVNSGLAVGAPDDSMRGVFYHSGAGGGSLVLGTITDHGMYLFTNNVERLHITNAGVVQFVQSPTAPTPAALDDTTKLATTAFVNHAARLQNNQSANYTFVLTDAGKIVLSLGASATVFTIPPFSSVAFPYGTQIDLIQIGGGQLSIAPGAGVNLYSEDNRRKLTKIYSTATLVNFGTDYWVLSGSLVA